MSEINSSSMLSVGTVLNGRYRIERHLSSGGFGNTYMATNLTFNDVVAVKEFFLRGISQRDGDSSTISVSNPENRELFTEQLEKFKKEAQRIRQLRSQHIVRVHDLFEANGTAYYMMDYIDGESLSARLKRTNMPLTEVETRKYFGQVLEALETIHGAGLCHMDLKPENIMVDKADNAILIDFGASKRSENERFTSTVSGVSYTNGYAPPEQLEQDTAHFGPWTDIYALGATLYKLLTNRKPPMPSAIYTDVSPDKHEVLPFPDNVSLQMRQIILQMMAVRWTDRPQTVVALRTIMRQPENAQTQVRVTDPYGGTAALEDDTLAQGVQPVYEIEETVEKSSTRKWLYGVIGFLTVALGVIVFILLKGEESQKAENSIVTTETAIDSVKVTRKEHPVVATLTAYYAKEKINGQWGKGDLICDSNDPINRIVEQDSYNYKYEGDDTGEYYSDIIPKSKIEKKTFTMNKLSISDVGNKVVFQSNDGCRARIFWSKINGHTYYTYGDDFKKEEDYYNTNRLRECYVLSVEFNGYDGQKYIFEEQLEEQQGEIVLYRENSYGSNEDKNDVRYRNHPIGFIEESWINVESWGYDKTAYDDNGNLLTDQVKNDGIPDYISIAYKADLDALYIGGVLYYRK